MDSSLGHPPGLASYAPVLSLHPYDDVESPYISDNINELKSLFADDVLALANTTESLKGFSSLDEKLSWLLFVDGCSLLHILVRM
ncbi:hypothetical protein RYX36_010955 [Vicia faba]